MKRTPPPPRKTPLPRSTKPIPRGKRPNLKRKGPARRVSVVRDRAYLDWLKTQPCSVSGSFGYLTDPAHGPVNGMSSKGPDSGAIPLTREYHEEQTRIGWPAFEAKYGIDRDALAAEHYARFKETKA